VQKPPGVAEAIDWPTPLRAMKSRPARVIFIWPALDMRGECRARGGERGAGGERRLCPPSRGRRASRP
jgi:hypothetical protein